MTSFDPGQAVHNLVHVGRVDERLKSIARDPLKTRNAQLREAGEIQTGFFESADSRLRGIVRAQSLIQVRVVHPRVPQPKLVDDRWREDMRLAGNKILYALPLIGAAIVRIRSRD